MSGEMVWCWRQSLGRKHHDWMVLASRWFHRFLFAMKDGCSESFRHKATAEYSILGE